MRAKLLLISLVLPVSLGLGIFVYNTSILIISMVENVKNLGGSGYVVDKTRHVLEQYLEMDQND